MKTKIGNLLEKTIFWINEDSYYVVTGREEITGNVFAKEFDDTGCLICREETFKADYIVETEDHISHQQ